MNPNSLETSQTSLVYLKWYLKIKSDYKKYLFNFNNVFFFEILIAINIVCITTKCIYKVKPSKLNC